jgi:hypothetical protein
VPIRAHKKRKSGGREGAEIPFEESPRNVRGVRALRQCVSGWAVHMTEIESDLPVEGSIVYRNQAARMFAKFCVSGGNQPYSLNRRFDYATD